MATSRIKSDLYSFDENIFYISQAQRYFIKYCLEHLPEGEDWIYEYLTDLYFDSLNNEFKSFYLEEIDEHKIVSDDHRRSIISGLLENSISELSKKSQDDFEKELETITDLDKPNLDVLDIRHFKKDKLKPDEAHQKPTRVIFVLANVLNLANQRKPLTYEEFKTNNNLYKKPLISPLS